jgi:hypothetical protein
MRRQTPPTFARPARGGVSWVTLALLAALVGGGYAVWMWGPVYLVHVEVKSVVHDYMNRAVRNHDDAKLVEDMIHKLNTLEELEVTGNDGKPARIPTVQLAAQDVTWERDARATPPVLHVAFDYTRPVAYPLLARWTSATFSVDLENDLTVPDWGPTR